GQVFGEVMADLLREGRIAVPISGGLDSRATVAVLRGGDGKVGHRLWAYSYGYDRDSVETRIARQVAERRGLPFGSFTIEPYLFERLDRILTSVEGFQDVTQCRQAAVLEEIGPRADYIIAAHWDDVWLDDIGLSGKEREAMSADAVAGHT